MGAAVADEPDESVPPDGGVGADDPTEPDEPTELADPFGAEELFALFGEALVWLRSCAAFSVARCAAATSLAYPERFEALRSAWAAA